MNLPRSAGSTRPQPLEKRQRDTIGIPHQEQPGPPARVHRPLARSPLALPFAHHIIKLENQMHAIARRSEFQTLGLPCRIKNLNLKTMKLDDSAASRLPVPGADAPPSKVMLVVGGTRLELLSRQCDEAHVSVNPSLWNRRTPVRGDPRRSILDCPIRP